MPLTHRLRLLRALAQGRSVRRRSDSVRYVRYFCRADEAAGMPLVDPNRTSVFGRIAVRHFRAGAMRELIFSPALPHLGKVIDEAA